jgi:hypothetical protein
VSLLFKPVTEFATRADYWDYMLRCQGTIAPPLHAAALAFLITEELKPAGESRASVWHANAVVFNRLDRCNCFPCTKERKRAALVTL